MAGWRRSDAISVVLPLPRKPVTRTTGSLSAKVREQTGVEGIEPPAGEPLRLEPNGAEIRHHDGSPFAIAQDVDSPSPVVEPQTEVGEHPIRELHPKDACPPTAVVLGPVLVEQRSTKGAHTVAL